MAWQLVGYTTGAGTGASYVVSLNGTLTGGIASSPSAGDLIVVIAGHGNTAASAPNVTGNNSGAYVGIGTAIHANDTWDTEVRPFYQIAGSTPDTSLTITRTNTTTYGGATVVQVWRGVDTTNPYIGVAQTSGTNSCVINCPSYNPAVTDSLIFAAGAGTMAATSSVYTGITGMSNFVTRKGDGSTSDCAVAMATFNYAGSAYDPAAISGGTTSTSSSWGGFTFAFRMFVPNAYTLDALNGTYSVTGQAQDISRNRSLSTLKGDYGLAGQTVDITIAAAPSAYELTATNGSYTVTGQSSLISRGRVLSVQNGAYSITGQTTDILRSKVLFGSNGSYTLTGQSTTITFTPLANNYSIDALVGSYVTTGQTATVLRSRLVESTYGVYSLSGQNADLAYYISNQYSIDAQTGTYVVGETYVDPGYVTPNGYFGNTSINRSFLITAQQGTYALTGRSTTLTRVYQYPPVHLVAAGTSYGPTGTEYTGTLTALTTSVKLDITTGALIKPINDKVVISL